jgi:hypothetical protein
MYIMRTIERRRRRASLVTQALRYQLDACCEAGRIQAMVVADDYGLPLASSGDPEACEEVAANLVHVAARTHAFSGTIFSRDRRWDVEMQTLTTGHGDLFVCAVGGSPEQRACQLARGASGARRILSAA